jgi:adenylylsulfate kinase-like enzyme
VGQPYESPLNAEVTIRNAELSPKVAAEKILESILALKC